jgi:glycosyltransferase involved in cell wall biosynthesis
VSDGFACAAVIPARNGLPEVLDAVASALDQSPAPAEIVVVDDSSDDGTGDAVERRFGTRVRLLRGRWGSAAAARNAGWRAARAPWIALLDADDLWLPGKLAEAAQRLAAAPDAAWFFSDGCFRTREGELRPSWLAPYAELEEGYVGQPVAQLLEVNFVLTSSVVMRREALEALGGFDESLTHAEDLELWIRLARRWPAAASPRALVRYQHRPGGLTQQVDARLNGDVTLFSRLAGDHTIAAPLRRVARRRAALAWYKRAIQSLRDGRSAEARARLRHAWLAPERVLPVVAAWTLSLLPAPFQTGVRRQGWAAQAAARPMLSHRRVSLRGATPRAGGAA